MTHRAARAVWTRILRNEATLPHCVDVYGRARMSRGVEKRLPFKAHKNMHIYEALVHFRTLVTLRRVRVGLGWVRVRIRVRIRLG